MAGAEQETQRVVFMKLFSKFRRADKIYLGYFSNPKVKNTAIKLLSRADETWYEGSLPIEQKLEETVKYLKKALMLIYEREVMLGGSRSPILEDFDSYREILNSSKLLKSFVSPPRAHKAPITSNPKVSVITYVNSNFLPPVVTNMENVGAAVSQYDATKDFGEDFPNSIHEMFKNLLIIRFDLKELLENRPWLNAMKKVEQDSDVVWYEWANRNAVFGSQYPYPNVRKVIRLHSYELLIPQIPLIDWSNIDEVVVVSPMMERVFRQSVPEAVHVDVTVISNFIDVTRFSTSKTPAASKNIGLIGWSPVAKDLAFALDVIDELKAQDSSFRLHLFGSEPDYEAAAKNVELVALYARLDALVEQGTVIKHGWIDRIEDKLDDIGFILSTSSRESFHLGLFEGVLSGAVPVVRKWPFWVDAGSPADFMPAEWIISNPKQAVNRVLSLQAGPIFESTRKDAVRFAYNFFDSVDYASLYRSIWES